MCNNRKNRNLRRQCGSIINEWILGRGYFRWICVIGVTKLLYAAFSPYLSQYFSGVLYSKDLTLEKALFRLEVLFNTYNCLFLPSMVIILSHSFKVSASLLFPLFVLIIDRLKIKHIARSCSYYIYLLFLSAVFYIL